jgi:single-strand DNA-binding protein
MNQVSMIGRLTRDPEMNYTQSGKAVANFTLAVDRRFKRDGEPDADFFRVTLWGKTAEVASQYLAKGKQVGISGSIHINRYTNKDGEERQSVDINGQSMTFCGSRSDGGGGQGLGNDAGVRDFSDDGLPF